jgi:hypothetical protein
VPPNEQPDVTCLVPGDRLQFPYKVGLGKSQLTLEQVSSTDYPNPHDFIGHAPGNYKATAAFNWKPGMYPAADSALQAVNAAVRPTARASAYQALCTAIDNAGYFVFIFAVGRALVAAKSVRATRNPYWSVDLGLVTAS